MRRILLFALLPLLALPACGAAEKEQEGKFQVDIFAAPGAEASEYAVELYDGEGLSIGNATLFAGKNFLDSSISPCFMQCAVGEALDCPVVYAAGTPLSLRVNAAEFSEQEGQYLHAYTVFLRGGEGDGYRLQICKMEGELTSYCKTAPFAGGAASLALADGEYLLELFAGSEVVLTRPLTFSYTDLRFCVIRLDEE